MRPVTIAAPPNYPYDNQLAEQAATKTFTANSATAIVYNPLPGTLVGPAIAFTFEEIMDELLDKAVLENAFPNQSTRLNRARCRNRMRETLTDGVPMQHDGYLAARPDLVAMIGEYCSFCELPLAGHLLAIEHRAPKEIYPTFMIWWWNFLLACRDCNSFKGTRPSRVTATGWSGVVAPTEQQLINTIIARYYWPDKDDDTYRAFPPTYWRATDTVAPVQLTPVDASNRDNQLRAQFEDSTRADVYDAVAGAVQMNQFVQVRIGNSATAAAIGTRTLVLTGLDRPETAREAQRTRAWLLICLRLRGLFDSVAAANGKAAGRLQFNGMWPFLLTLAVQTGFYSVWVEILTGYAFPPNMDIGGLQADLGAQFVFDTNPANNHTIQETFPGTNYTEVP